MCSPHDVDALGDLLAKTLEPESETFRNWMGSTDVYKWARKTSGAKQPGAIRYAMLVAFNAGYSIGKWRRDECQT